MAGRTWLALHILAVLLSAHGPLAAPKDLSRRRVADQSAGMGAAKGTGVGMGPAKGPRPTRPKGAGPPRRAKGTGNRPTKGTRKATTPSGKVAPRGQKSAAARAARNKAIAAKRGWPNAKTPGAGKAPGIFGSKDKRKKFAAAGKGKGRSKAGAKSAKPQRPPGKSAPRGKGALNKGKGRSNAKGPPQRKAQRKAKSGRSISDAKMKDFQQKQLLQFKMIDTDGDGQLTPEEVLVAKQNLTAKYDAGDVMESYESVLRTRMLKEGWVDSVDTDKDGKLTIDEFKFFKKLDHRLEKKQLDFQQKQEMQFKLVDSDKDGEITAEEVEAARAALKERYEAEKAGGEALEGFESLLLRRMAKDGWMKNVDTNGDGRLTFDEFKFFKKLAPRPQEL